MNRSDAGPPARSAIRLILKNWTEQESLRVELTGLDLDKVWVNIVAGDAGMELQQGKTLNEQLAVQQKREKLQKEIAKLEKLAWAEKQPKRKMEYVQRMKSLQNKLGELQ